MAAGGNEQFSVFVQKPALKVALGVLAVALLLWMGYAAWCVFGGTQLPLSSVSGWYTSDEGYSLHLGDSKGSVSKGDDRVEFSFVYDRGRLYCSDILPAPADGSGFYFAALQGGLCYWSKGSVVFARL